MKKNACLLVGFLAFLCMSGQSPRKEMHEITTVEEPKKQELKVEKENPRKSAAQRVREYIPGQTTEEPKSAAKKVIEAEIARFDQN